MTLREEVDAIMDRAAVAVEHVRRDPAHPADAEAHIRRVTVDENISTLLEAVHLLSDRIDRLER